MSCIDCGAKLSMARYKRCRKCFYKSNVNFHIANKKIVSNQSGKNNANWKGDKVKYSGLHLWVESQLGKPLQCSNCKTRSAKQFHWASLTHYYVRDLNDWVRLCISCHRYYDAWRRGILTL